MAGEYRTPQPGGAPRPRRPRRATAAPWPSRRCPQPAGTATRKPSAWRSAARGPHQPAGGGRAVRRRQP
eukprot:11162185-Lingulodinium_polyedra.AAC.1